MKVRLTAYTITEVSMCGVELDIPDEIVSQGHDAVETWCKSNVSEVDFAPTDWTETGRVREVTGIADIKRL